MSKEVVFELTRKHVSFWDLKAQTWVILVGYFTLRVWFSSENVKANAKQSVIDWNEDSGT